jgi:hypothetical protein
MVNASCHCGNLSLTLETSVDPRELPLRACACSFCRRHAARTASDPAGRIRIAIRGAASRYRWGLATADFLVCARCGVYLGALMSEGARAWAIVNVNAVPDQGPFRREAEPVSYEGETAEQRIARRKARWTPAEVVEGTLPSVEGTLP